MICYMYGGGRGWGSDPLLHPQRPPTIMKRQPVPQGRWPITGSIYLATKKYYYKQYHCGMYDYNTSQYEHLRCLYTESFHTESVHNERFIVLNMLSNSRYEHLSLFV